jgi:hypothetical protein
MAPTLGLISTITASISFSLAVSLSREHREPGIFWRAGIAALVDSATAT